MVLGLHAVGAQIAVASRSDGHLIEGVEMRQGFEIPLEGQTPLLEQFDVRLVVGQEFLLEIERHPTRHLVSVPPFEILAALDAHAVGQVGVLGWQGPHVVLVGPGVEEVGEIPFLQFGQAKGLGKGRQRHLKKGQEVDEANVPHLQLQDLGAIPGPFQQSLLTVVFLHQGVAIIALKIVGQHRQGTSRLSARSSNQVVNCWRQVSPWKRKGSSSTSVSATTKLGMCCPSSCRLSMSKKTWKGAGAVSSWGGATCTKQRWL